jgi:integrase
MSKFSYNISSVADQNGESQIMIRAYVSREQRFRIKSGIRVSSKRWGKKNEINIPLVDGVEREELLEKRVKLKALTEFLETEILNMTNKELITKEWVEKRVDLFHKPVRKKREKETSPPETFFTVFDEFLNTHKLSEVRRKNLRVLYRALQRYELYKRLTGSRKFELAFDYLTPDTLSDIEDFLSNEPAIFTKYPEIYKTIPYATRQCIKTPKRKPKVGAEPGRKTTGEPSERGQNTICDLMTKFRTVVIWAFDGGYAKHNPFKRYSVGECVYGTPFYITNEERNRLYEADFSHNKQLEIQRDIFIFQCLIGCRVSDLYKMTYRNIIDGAIEYIPRKTKEDRAITVRVPLNKTAKEIIERYRDNERELLFPLIVEQKYNQYIKQAVQEAKIVRMVTIIDQKTRLEVQKPIWEVASSHMARRSFIGNIYKQVKDPNLVGALSGHKEGSKAFARYRTIDDDMKKELIGMLE